MISFLRHESNLPGADSCLSLILLLALSPGSLYSSVAGFLSVPGASQVPSSCQDEACGVPSAWNSLPRTLYRARSLSSIRHPLKNHLSKGPFPLTSCTVPVILHLSSMASILTLVITNTHLSTHFHSFSSSAFLEHRLRRGRGIVCITCGYISGSWRCQMLNIRCLMLHFPHHWARQRPLSPNLHGSRGGLVKQKIKTRSRVS